MNVNDIIRELLAYFYSKRDMGLLVCCYKFHSMGKSGVRVEGISWKIFKRVLLPEIRQIAPVVTYTRRSLFGYVDVYVGVGGEWGDVDG